jgi:hypothetical protein
MRLVEQIRSFFRGAGWKDDEEAEALITLRNKAVELRDGDRFYLAEYLRREVFRLATELGNYKGEELLRVAGKIEAFANFAQYLENLQDIIDDLDEEIKNLNGGVRSVR